MCERASRVPSEQKQDSVSCLLQPLRKIYLYLQFDAFNPVRAQVTVWQEEDTRTGAGVRTELQPTSIDMNAVLVLDTNKTFLVERFISDAGASAALLFVVTLL